MIELNKEKILTGTPVKALHAKFEELKQDYTKYNAIEYESFYSEMALTDLLDGSEYIFTEPMRGCSFYKDLMESCVIPYERISEEYDKVKKYFEAHKKKMSGTMLTEYTDLMDIMERKMASTENTRMMYETFHDNTHANDTFYNVGFNRYDGVIEESGENPIFSKKTKGLRLIDAITLGVANPEKNGSSLYRYLTEEAIITDPKTPKQYQLNAYTTNVVKRMMRDSYISEKVNALGNMNLRTLLKGLAKEDQSDFINSALMESHTVDDLMVSTGENSVNQIFDDLENRNIYDESESVEKMHNLMCEKAIVAMNESFLAMDALYGVTAESTANWDPIVERLCIESSSIEKIPTDINEQVGMLKNLSEKIDSEYQVAYESYFKSNGDASRVVAQTTGELPMYRPTKASEIKKDDQSLDSQNDEDDTDDDDEDEDTPDTSSSAKSDEQRAADRDAAKARQTAKYANMDISDFNFNEASEDEDEKDNKSGNATSDAKSSDEDVSAKPIEVEKPQKRPFFQRIQNRALDANAKFHKHLSKLKRTSIDAKNAAKATGKIPSGINGMIKKQIDDWEEMDDDRRKEYIIKPGSRKKVFRALKIAIEHGIAFAINPLLNIVLLIAQKLSHEKDIRIRNELVRELQAEKTVVNAKIEDMSGDPKMRNEKYRMMRIKDKLDAEIVRISANSNYV